MKATYPCEIPGCESVFLQGYQLKKHKVWHEDKTKLFFCEWEGCTFYTETRRNLYVHFKGHTGVKDLMCPDTVTVAGKSGSPDRVTKCPLKTNDPSVLWKHRVKAHGHKPTPYRRPRTGTFEFIHCNGPLSLGNTDRPPASSSSASRAGSSTRARKRKPATRPESSLAHTAGNASDSTGFSGETLFQNTFPSTFLPGQAQIASPEASGSDTPHLQNYSTSVFTARGQTRAGHLDKHTLAPHAPFDTAEQSANIRLPYSSSFGTSIDPCHWQFTALSPEMNFQPDSGRATEGRFAAWETSSSQASSDHSSSDYEAHVEDKVPSHFLSQTPPSSVCSELEQSFAELPQEAPVASIPVNPLEQPAQVGGFSSGTLGTGITPSIHPYHYAACDTTTRSQVEWHVERTGGHALWPTTSIRAHSAGSSSNSSAEHMVPQYFTPPTFQTAADEYGQSPRPNGLDVSRFSNSKSVVYDGYGQHCEPQHQPAGFENNASVAPMIPPVDLSAFGVHAQAPGPTSASFAAGTYPTTDNSESNTVGTGDFKTNVPQSDSNRYYAYESWDASQWNHFYNAFPAWLDGGI